MRPPLRTYVLLLALLLLPAGLVAANEPAAPAQLPDSTARAFEQTVGIDPESVVSRIMAWYEQHMTYGAITVLMALESSFLPIPSEIVISPAAYLASDPESELNFFLVILFATIGSLIGALILYGLAAWVGRKALYRFADSHVGSFLMLDSDKIRHAEDVFRRHSKSSVCVGRFIAGIRMLISIPAGLARMNLAHFAFFTFIGSAVYNTAMAVIGYLLHGQADLIHRYSYELSVITLLATALAVLVFAVRYLLLRLRSTKAYGLIGHPLGHSFSKRYFTAKFKREKINAQYKLYDLERIDGVQRIIRREKVRGLNVTIPYKEAIIPYCDELDDTAARIGAVNVLKITHLDGRTRIRGYNTDATGFEQSIRPHLRPHHTHALVLGTGGASKAVAYVLRRLGLAVTHVSRTAKPDALTYEALDRATIEAHTVIVNATPLGTFPRVDTCPPLPYEWLGDRHLLFDLVYNPAETLFLQKGKARGCDTVNGEQMLIGQAEAAWTIWNEEDDCPSVRG